MVVEPAVRDELGEPDETETAWAETGYRKLAAA
jgi:hypothetical protein